MTATGEDLQGTHVTLPNRRVSWGIGALRNIRDTLDELDAAKALLLTTGSLARERNLVETVEAALGTSLVGRFDALPAHVPEDAVAAAAAGAQDTAADVLVCFGGGSVIDAGKAVAARGAKDSGAPINIISLPTTLSGAEVTHYYGITETQSGNRYKRSYVDPAVTPVAAILDPELTVATPQELWLSSGIKALDHAIEGLLNSAPRPISDPVALAGIRAMAMTLPQTRKDGALRARLTCQLAAWQCFYAPANTHMGLSHRIGHVLGGTFSVSHSLTSCLTLAPVMHAFETLEPVRLRAIGAALTQAHAGGLPEPGVAAASIGDLIAELGLPGRLSDVGIERAALTKIVSLVAEHYPADVNRLAADGEAALLAMLESIC